MDFGSGYKLGHNGIDAGLSKSRRFGIEWPRTLTKETSGYCLDTL